LLTLWPELSATESQSALLDHDVRGEGTVVLNVQRHAVGVDDLAIQPRGSSVSAAAPVPVLILAVPVGRVIPVWLVCVALIA
jgi:hypothetical protein